MSINRYLEHTFLKPTISSEIVVSMVQAGMENQLSGICIPPYWVKKAAREISTEHALNVVTVVGFPLGYQQSESKVTETVDACNNGANEIDMVMNLAAFRENPKSWVKPEIAKLASICHDHGAILKVILETAYLTDKEIATACRIAQDAGADFVKTSTGFAPEGAKVEHIKLMRSVVGVEMGIKASGGIKTLDQALAMIEAGADRIGTSSGVEIVNEWRKREQH